MRSMKKLFGDDLLQLALLLSLMKVDPENYLGFSPHSPLDPGGDMTAGQTWAQTQSMVSHISSEPSEYLSLYLPTVPRQLDA